MMMDKFRYTCFLFSCQLCILSTPHSHLFTVSSSMTSFCMTTRLPWRCWSSVGSKSSCLSWPR